MESTVLASPQITLQAVVVSFTNATDTALTRELWNTMTANALQWADDGWGGIATSNIAIYINPKMDSAEAARSMSPLIELGKKLQNDQVEGAQVLITQFESWATFFDWFAADNVAVSVKHRFDPSQNFLIQTDPLYEKFIY